MPFWPRLFNWSPLLRWPLKLALFLLIAFIVHFPHPGRLQTLIARASDFNALIDSNEPRLAELETEVRAGLAADAAPSVALAKVERVVYQHVPYQYDWVTWGNAEYIPTTAEVFDRGAEDCDGRAVVAASLLRRMGYQAWLVTDLLHVWVETPQGEAMSPTSHDVVITAGKPGTEGTQLVTWNVARNIVRNFGYGVAVFPLPRELIILAAACFLTWHPRVGGWRFFSGGLLAWIGLDLVRHRGERIPWEAGPIDFAIIAAGAALMLAGWMVMALRASSPRPSSAPAPSG